MTLHRRVTHRPRKKPQRILQKTDEEQQLSISSSAVQAALEKLKQHPEPEAGFMLMGRNTFQQSIGMSAGLLIAIP